MTVSVSVTDSSGVKNVTVVYTTDNWATVAVTLLSAYNATTSVATAQIPAQTNGGHVVFYVAALDTNDNKAVTGYYSYDVPAPPSIGTPAIQPGSPGAGDPVTILVSVTSGLGVGNVSVTYTTDNWNRVNITILGRYDTTSHTAVVTIPAVANGGRVAYYVVAFDSAGNKAVNDNAGAYFIFDVPTPWYLNTLVLGSVIAVAATGVAAVLMLTVRRRRRTAL